MLHGWHSTLVTVSLTCTHYNNIIITSKQFKVLSSFQFVCVCVFAFGVFAVAIIYYDNVQSYSVEIKNKIEFNPTLQPVEHDIVLPRLACHFHFMCELTSKHL